MNIYFVSAFVNFIGMFYGAYTGSLFFVVANLFFLVLLLAMGFGAI